MFSPPRRTSLPSENRLFLGAPGPPIAAIVDDEDPAPNIAPGGDGEDGEKTRDFFPESWIWTILKTEYVSLFNEFRFSFCLLCGCLSVCV